MVKGNGIDVEYFSMKKENVRKRGITRETQRLLWENINMQFEELIQNVEELKNRTDKLYIYGAGFYGKDIYRILKNNAIFISGFLVTDNKECSEIMELPVLTLEKVINENIGIIVAVSPIYKQEIYQYLENKKVDIHKIIDAGKYLYDVAGKSNTRNSMNLEITAIMGCKVNCKYCPQQTLLNKYFENNPNRKVRMTKEDFQKILNNTPKNCGIIFAGMSEIFLNKEGIDFIDMACKQERYVTLFTTLEGADLETVRKLIQLPIKHVTLHVADKQGYANILLTDEYFEKMKVILNATKEDGSAFVDFINAQAEVDTKILELCQNYQIANSLHDRAGNLEGKELTSRKKKISKNEKIYCDYVGEKFDTNVVLPDGTVLLCCMDYGMKHIIGNLYLDKYEDILNGKEMMKIYEAANGLISDDLLCRNCLSARIRNID